MLEFPLANTKEQLLLANTFLFQGTIIIICFLDTLCGQCVSNKACQYGCEIRHLIPLTSEVYKYSMAALVTIWDISELINQASVNF